MHDSTIGTIDYGLAQGLIDIFSSPILQVINAYIYDKGLDLDYVLSQAHMDFISFGATQLMMEQDYMVINTNPVFTLEKFSNNLKKMMEDQLERIVGEENKFSISEKMIIDLIDYIWEKSKGIDWFDDKSNPSGPKKLK